MHGRHDVDARRPQAQKRRVRVWLVPVWALFDFAICYLGVAASLAVLVYTGSFGVPPAVLTITVSAVLALAGAPLTALAPGEALRRAGVAFGMLAVVVGLPLVGIVFARHVVSAVLALLACCYSAAMAVLRRSTFTVALVAATILAALVVWYLAFSPAPS